MTTDDLQQFEIDQGWKHLKTMWRVKHGETIHHLKGMPVLSLCSWMYAMVSMLVQQNADTHPARPCLMAGAASLFKVFPRALSFHVSQHRIQTLSTIVSFGNMANAAASYCWGRLLECLQIYQCCTKRSKRGIQLDMLAGRSSRVYHVQERQIVPGHRFTYTLSAFASSSSTCSLIKVIGWKLASLLDISPVGYENINCGRNEAFAHIVLMDWAGLSNVCQNFLPAVKQWSSETLWVLDREVGESSVPSASSSGTPELTALTTGVITATLAWCKWWRMVLGVDCKACEAQCMMI